MKKILVIILASLLVFSGCNNDEKTEKKTEKKQEKEVLEVDYSYEFTKDGGLLVSLGNPENEIVNIIVDIVYFDEQDEEISKDSKEVINVDELAEVKTVFRNIPENAQDFTVETSYKVVDDVESFANILDVTTNDDGNSITVIASNYDDVAIQNTTIGIVFYDSDKVVAYSEVNISDIGAKSKGQVVVDYPKDVNGYDIMFDRIITKVNNSYNVK